MRRDGRRDIAGVRRLDATLQQRRGVFPQGDDLREQRDRRSRATRPVLRLPRERPLRVVHPSNHAIGAREQVIRGTELREEGRCALEMLNRGVVLPTRGGDASQPHLGRRFGARLLCQLTKQRSLSSRSPASSSDSASFTRADRYCADERCCLSRSAPPPRDGASVAAARRRRGTATRTWRARAPARARTFDVRARTVSTPGAPARARRPPPHCPCRPAPSRTDATDLLAGGRGIGLGGEPRQAFLRGRGSRTQHDHSECGCSDGSHRLMKHSAGVNGEDVLTASPKRNRLIAGCR